MGYSGLSTVLKVFPDTCEVGKYFLFLLCLQKVGILPVGSGCLIDSMLASILALHNVISIRFMTIQVNLRARRFCGNKRLMY